MDSEVKRKLEETEKHVQLYINDPSQTPELRKMCKNCESYCGKEHDYSECRDKWCYRFWLAFEYLNWASGY